MIAVAKERRLREKYPTLSFSFKENKRRFSLFVKEFHSFVEQRKRVVDRLKKKEL